MPSPINPVYLIYSPSESARRDGAGFWSNDDGWVTFDSAELFGAYEIARIALPMASGHDAHIVPWTRENHRNSGRSSEGQLPDAPDAVACRRIRQRPHHA